MEDNVQDLADHLRKQSDGNHLIWRFIYSSGCNVQQFGFWRFLSFCFVEIMVYS